MTHQQRHVESGPPGIVGEQAIELLPDETEPVDPGVDMQRRTGRRTMRRGTLDPSIDTIQIEQARNQAVLVQDVGLVADARHEHEYLHVAEDPPDLHRLVAEPGEERAAAGRVQGARNLRGPEPVAVRLDHTGDLGGGKRGDGAIVPGQCGDVHYQTGRRIAFAAWADSVVSRLPHVRTPPSPKRSGNRRRPHRPSLAATRHGTERRRWRPRVRPISILSRHPCAFAARPHPPPGAPP